MIQEYVNDLASRSKVAAAALRLASGAKRNEALIEIAETLKVLTEEILEANEKDLVNARAAGLSGAMLDRLTLTPERIQAMAKGVQEIAAFKDPVGRIFDEATTELGLKIAKVSVPIGSILFIYESRPNVTIDGAALCIKSGNAVILRGGKESLNTSKLLADVVRQCLERVELIKDAVLYVDQTDRAVVSELLLKEKELDLVIPRGGEGLIQYVVSNSRIPVIKHYKGVCHVYIDQSANPAHALDIVLNAKTQRTGVCNAMESLLLDTHLSEDFQNAVVGALAQKGVKLLGNSASAARFSQVERSDSDPYGIEFLDMIASVALVDGVEGAIVHIEKYGSGHTEAVVAENAEVQDQFVVSVDSSSVMVNASTRFADGGQYGLGAEVGISTDKLHARGPMGVDSLCTYKWVVRGNGQVRK